MARIFANFAEDKLLRLTPPILTLPDCKGSNPDKQFSKVVFPEPDGPIIATHSRLIGQNVLVLYRSLPLSVVVEVSPVNSGAPSLDFLLGVVDICAGEELFDLCICVGVG